MGLLAKQTMRVKDMFSKNEKKLFIFFIIIFLFSKNSYSENSNKNKALDYLNSLKYFSASFIQNDGENLSEGKVYIGNKRVRADYSTPTKILIILDENKAMYYDYELEEDEFFNPKNTNAWFFYDIFRNPLFFEDGILFEKNNELIIEKNGFDNTDKKFLIRVFFEKNPFTLRAIEVDRDDNFLRLSIYNHNYNEEFDEDFFKLINPQYLN